MLASDYRFHGHNSLRYVYKNGQTTHSRLFKVKWTANPRRQKPRFAVVVSKKVHKSAVGRNRIRRLFYEAIRTQLDVIRPDTDVVIIITSGETLNTPYHDIVTSLQPVFQEATLYK